MSAASPSLHTGEPVRIEISSDGRDVDIEALVSVETWSEANRIPRARLVLTDAQRDSKDFPISESETFVPGAKISIAAGYGSERTVIHSGIVIRHSLRLAPGGSPELEIETADPLLKMTLVRSSAVALQKSDKDLIAALVRASGGSMGTNAAAATPAEAIVQYHSSDWDLMLLRAEASGCVVLVEDSGVDIVSPAESASPVLLLEYGDSIVSFDATIDASAPFAGGAVKSGSWSYSKQKFVEGAAGRVEVVTPGNLDAAALAGVFGLSLVRQQSGAYIPDAQLADWSTGRLMRSKLAAVQGTVQFQGSALVGPGKFVTLQGLGARFDGDAFVSAVTHRIRDGRWQTVATLGMGAETFAKQSSDVAAAPASGLAPPIRGLHIGQVKQVAQDPSGDHRVLVTLPLAESTNGIWARLGQFYASKAFGAVFFPEIGDEVVLGFMDEDPANPVILGSLYSSTRAPAYPPNDANDRKAIVTRSKMEITFDDKDVIFEITTPKGRKLKLDDKAGEVKVTDPFGNSILMDQAKVDIVSGKAMNLSSKTDMTIAAGTNLTVSAKSKYDLSALQVSETAKASLSIASSGTGELKVSGPLTISGALVKIN